MPTLIDTTIRLLGQDPLAGRVPTAEQLRIAEILDQAGFGYLEVSGGGCFESAERRGERHRRLPAARSAERRLEPARGGRGRRRGRARLRGGPRLLARSHRRD